MLSVNGFLVDPGQGVELCTWSDIGWNGDSTGEQDLDQRCVTLGTQPSSEEGLKSPSVGLPG